jgi:hypothetical protein
MFFVLGSIISLPISRVLAVKLFAFHCLRNKDAMIVVILSDAATVVASITRTTISDADPGQPTSTDVSSFSAVTLLVVIHI